MQNATNKLNPKLNKMMHILTVVVWSQRDIPKHLDMAKKRIKLLRLAYALIVAFACLASVLSLINPAPSIKHDWEQALIVIQITTFFVFLTDFILHFITYKYKENIHEPKSIWQNIKFPITFLGIVLILCILSSIHVIGYLGADENVVSKIEWFKSLNIMKIVRLFFILSLFGPFAIIINIFQKQRKILTIVFAMILFLILLFSLLIWNNEIVYLETIQQQWKDTHPEIIDFENNSDYKALSDGYITNFSSAFYFTTITLTTIGYGELVPHAPTSRAIVIIIALLGIALIAVPSGIVSSAFLSDIQTRYQSKPKTKKEHKND